MYSASGPVVVVAVGFAAPGEDPTLNADYAAGFVGGFQTGEDDTSRIKASSCCKHLDAAYSMENSDNQTRHNTNAIVTEQDLADSYFPAFISCANRGNASGIMCSYNAVK
jgi:beta-glucosidase-like glycosyl hydrolase